MVRSIDLFQNELHVASLAALDRGRRTRARRCDRSFACAYAALSDVVLFLHV